MSEFVISSWSYQTEHHASTWVLPDGCRDLIRRQARGKPPRWYVTSLDDAPRMINSQPNEEIRGFRLRPGVLFPEAELIRTVQLQDCRSAAKAAIERYGYVDAEVDEALAGLSIGAKSVAAVALSLGVSVRSLQRKVKGVTGMPPVFWLGLARARRAARALVSDLSLAEIAFEQGYADQAHLTRELRRWFGQPPAKIRQDREAIQQIQGAGFGTV